jgi:acetyl-CoA C-acetyltransferase
VEARDAMLVDGLCCAFDGCHMGEHAEYTARKFRLTRAELDAYAVESQKRAARALSEGDFAEELALVPDPKNSGGVLLAADEGPRADSSVESLAKLKPAFDPAGAVTAANASMLSDGAAAVVVADEATMRASPAPLKARVVAYHTSGTEPRDLFIAPVPAVQGVLKKAGMKQDDTDLFEINEAFASQMLACIRELDLDVRKVNVNGGAIALGHPIGASGARVLVTLLWALKKRGLKRGLASLCLGGGNAVAMIVERA